MHIFPNPVTYKLTQLRKFVIVHERFNILDQANQMVFHTYVGLIHRIIYVEN